MQGNLFSDQEMNSAPAALKVAPPPAHSLAEKNIGNTDHHYHLVATEAQRKNLIELLSKQPSLCFDTETTGIDPNEAELVGMSFSVKAGEAYYVPVPEDQELARTLVHEFKALLENKSIAKIAQNIKYDATMLKWYGVELQGEYCDTMIAHYLLEPELRPHMD